MRLIKLLLWSSASLSLGGAQECTFESAASYSGEAMAHGGASTKIFKFRDTSNLPKSGETPKDVMPGVISELSKGIDITAGDPWVGLRMPVFEWTWRGDKINWNGKVFSYPNELSIAIKNECRIADVQTSNTATSFSETMSTEAESRSGGFDTGPVDIGIEIPDTGVGIGFQIQNTMMFGKGRVAMDYESQYSQSRTMSILTQSRASAYTSQMSYFGINDATFHPNFKAAVKWFASDPTKENAHEFFDNYGTHFIQKAELGGVAERNMFFSENVDMSSAESYSQDQQDSGIDWLFWHSHQSSSSTTDVKTTSGETGTVFNTATYIMGGDPSSETSGEFCASVQQLQTPRVTEFVKLKPLWDFIDRIDGVEKEAGEKMKEHALAIFEDGERCAIEKCKGSIAMCSWQPDTRRWETPCKCISPNASMQKREEDTIHWIELIRHDGVRARFAGWTVHWKTLDPPAEGDYADHDRTDDIYRIDTHADCFVWEDGVSGKSNKMEHRVVGYWFEMNPNHVQRRCHVMLNDEPHIEKADISYIPCATYETPAHEQVDMTKNGRFIMTFHHSKIFPHSVVGTQKSEL